MTPTDRFVEAGADSRRLIESMRQVSRKGKVVEDAAFLVLLNRWQVATESFADAECEGAEYPACARRVSKECTEMELWTDETEAAEHVGCRAALLKRVMES